MSLGAPDEQALDEIDRRLHAEDPRLGLLFGIFARLTRQEGMPRWERLDPPGLATRLRRRSRRPRDRRWVRRNGWPSGWGAGAVPEPAVTQALENGCRASAAVQLSHQAVAALEPVRAEPTQRVTHLTYAIRER